MSELKNGPFSGFTGRTGQLVGYRKKGKWIMAARKATAPKPPSVLQLNQQMKFGLVTSWLGWVGDFIDLGFQHYDAKMSAMNAAVKYNLDNAVTGVSPNYVMDYPQVLFSKGRLAEAYLLEMATLTPFQLDFTWQNNIGSVQALPTDKAVFIVYNPLKDLFMVANGVVTRSALSYDMILPADFSGDTVQVYMAFTSADGKIVSTSAYVGAIQVL